MYKTHHNLLIRVARSAWATVSRFFDGYCMCCAVLFDIPKHAWRQLTLVSPGIYFLLYFTCIPVFAILYCINADHFRHTAIRSEPNYLRQQEYMIDEIREALIEAMCTAQGSAGAFSEDEKLTVLPKGISISQLTCDEQQIRFVICLNVESSDSNIPSGTCYATATMPFTWTQYIQLSEPQEGVETGGRQILPFAKIQASGPPETISWRNELPKFSPPPQFDITKQTYYHEVLVDELALSSVGMPVVEFPMSRVFLLDKHFGERKKNSFGLGLPLDVEERLQTLRRAVNGCPDRIPGLWGRMLYLSAVTITTLGYGDIVPVTSTTRAIVACEAVVGVLIVGLFINSIANLRKRNSP